MHVAVFIFALLNRPFDFRAAGNPALMGILRDLGVRGANKAGDMEVAAFITQNTDGTLSCVLWPHTASIRAAHYQGAIPAGTVALAHTHPQQLERPSSGDIAQAKRIGLPIYVISRWYLYVIDPSSGASIALITQKNWMRSPQPAEIQVVRN